MKPQQEPNLRRIHSARDTTSNTPQPNISVIIKARNEETKIARCIESVLANLANEIPAEVIVVDSRSTDDTVEIALRYPVRLVQFLELTQCNCGSAVELGFRYSNGQFLLLLDGDMELVPGFIEHSLDKLVTDHRIAGIGGQIVEHRDDTSSPRSVYSETLAKRNLSTIKERCVAELGGGGLYRRQAIESVGYFGHQGLPAYEEAELGLRLRKAGWRLVRTSQPSALHRGHVETTAGYWRRMWRNRRAFAAGQLLKAAFRNDTLYPALAKVAHPLGAVAITLTIIASTLAIYSAAPLGKLLLNTATALILVWFIAAILLVARGRSIRSSFELIATLHYFGIGAIAGLMLPLAAPESDIPAVEIHRGSRE